MQCLPSGDLLDNMMHNIWPQDFLSLFLVLPAPCRENPEKKSCTEQRRMSFHRSWLYIYYI